MGHLATCIGCGCDDDHACDTGCAWLSVDHRAGLGVCSECHGDWQRFLDMKKARYFVPVHYKIARALTGSHYVNGFAIRLPAPFTRLRFCVRVDGHEWFVDHYDSGLAVSGPTFEVGDKRRNVIAYALRWRRKTKSRTAAVRWLGAYLKHLLKSGRLRKRFGAVGYGWCLREAGI